MKSSRIGFGAALAVAFICGLIFASGMDLTSFSWAQTRITPTLQTAQVPAKAVASLDETQTAFEAIVDRVKPAVVSIHVTRYAREAVNSGGQRGQGRNRSQAPSRPQNIPPGLEDFMKQFGDQLQMPDPADRGQEGSGSGFIVSKDGYILTNNHVVANMDRVSVTLPDKRTFDAKVIGRDPTTDVAVVKIEGNNFPFVSLGDEATSRVGQWVLAIGNPLELDFTVTAGIISAKNRKVDVPGRSSYSITDFIQTDAAINPGNSGGPLVNIRGEVIGINSAIQSATGYYSGYGLAIPIGLAKTVMTDLIEHGEVRRAIVGVSLLEVDPEDAEAAGLKEIRGAKVADFTDDDSPAKKAGLEVGDVITAVDGKPVEQVNSLQRIIRDYRVGQTAKIEVMRFGQKKEFNIKLTSAKPDAAVQALNADDELTAEPVFDPKPNEKLGLTVSPIPTSLVKALHVPDQVKTGLIVRSVSQRGVAFQRLFPNDMIDEVLYPVRRDIKSMDDLNQALAGLKSGQVVTFKVWNPAAKSFSTQSVRLP